MPQLEFIRLYIDDNPSDIITGYNLPKFIDSSNNVNFKIKKGMYGLKQAVIVAYNQLKKNLAPHGHYPIPDKVEL